MQCLGNSRHTIAFIFVSIMKLSELLLYIKPSVIFIIIFTKVKI